VPASPLDPHAATAAELQERIGADRRGVPYLVFREPDGGQRIEALGERRHATVGRAPACDVCLSWDTAVSGVHAELERLADDWAVVDDGLSRNGTFVNGEPAPLHVVQETAPATGAPAEVALSPAQRRVLVALCRPLRDGGAHAAPASNRQIADELVLSVEAVKTHLRVLFGKFGVEELPHNRKRARLAELALQSGTIGARDLTP